MNSSLGSRQYIETTEQFSAHNYSPVPVVISEGEGIWVKDVEGNLYMDMLSAYSALNFGHKNKRINAVAIDQINKLSLTSRAFYTDLFGVFCRELAEFCNMESVLMMNSGAEAVETAIKAARKWGYEKKKVAPDRAEIICFNNNFHGRTTTIVGFSTSSDAKTNFGPFTPGFLICPFGEIDLLREKISPNTVAILIEPIQGEGGVIIPPEGYLREIRKLCDENRILLIADEIQTGLGRTGEVFCCDHEGVKPDMYILGKSLGGGLVPVSAIVSSREVMEVFTPGSHGSTFGGNPLACRVGLEVLRLIREEEPHKMARESGAYFLKKLSAIKAPCIEEIRARGLMIGIDIDPTYGSAKDFCKKLKEEGVLCKDTRKRTIRFAPPLAITREEIDWALKRIEKVFTASQKVTNKA
jgi:ornithine--oxo-acid transaminase